MNFTRIYYQQNVLNSEIAEKSTCDNVTLRIKDNPSVGKYPESVIDIV